MLFMPGPFALLALMLSPQPVEEMPFIFADDEAERSEAIGMNELRAHVYRLAGPEFLGRRGPGAARAALHLEEKFRGLGLKPAFGGSYIQSIPWLVKKDQTAPTGFVGRNVAAVLEGSDPDLQDEWIILDAHYDHLGVADGKFYPGADDNASGVAMLLEVAEWFALHKEKPKRTVMFVAFDLEESALLGSTHFAAHPPRDIKKLKAVLTADMLGRSLPKITDDMVFALGSESSPRLRRLLEAVRPEAGLSVGRLGTDLIGTRGDYGPFRDRRIPFLFLSTGQHPDYHRPTDLPERLDYEKLGKISRWIAELTWRLANDVEAPIWCEAPVSDMEEIRVILKLMARAQNVPLVLTQTQRRMIDDFSVKLKVIQDRGEITAMERTWLVWTARLLLMMVF